MHISEGFQQTPLALQPLYTSDPALRTLLERLLPTPIFDTVDAELVRFQSRLAGPIHDLALLADAAGEPTLTQFDHWGRRVDVLSTSEGWRRLKGVAAEEGSVGVHRHQGTIGTDSMAQTRRYWDGEERGRVLSHSWVLQGGAPNLLLPLAATY